MPLRTKRAPATSPASTRTMFPRGYRLFSSMLLRPTLPGLEIEKRIITEEALEDINERGEEINNHNLASRLLWPGHPLGTPTIGYLETIENFTCEDLQTHLTRFYTPRNTVVVIAGDIRADVAFTACEESFDAWRGPGVLPAPAPVNRQGSPQSLFVEDSDSQVHVLIAFRGFARPDRRIMATRLLRRMLCGSGSSRLNLLLREKLGIVYSVDASISAYEETGSFAVELSTAPENLPLAVTEVLREAGRMSREPASPEEIERVKRGYYFDLEYSRDSNYEMQVRYGWGELMGLVRSIEEDQAEAATIDGEALRSTAEALFAPHNLNVVAVGPWKAAARRKVEEIVADYEKEWKSRCTGLRSVNWTREFLILLFHYFRPDPPDNPGERRHLLRRIPFHKLDVGRISRHLTECRVNSYPSPRITFGPAVVEETPSRNIDEAGNEPGRYPRRPCESSIEPRMGLAVPLPGPEGFQRGLAVDDTLLDVRIYPADELLHSLQRVLFRPQDCLFLRYKFAVVRQNAISQLQVLHLLRRIHGKAPPRRNRENSLW